MRPLVCPALLLSLATPADAADLAGRASVVDGATIDVVASASERAMVNGAGPHRLVRHGNDFQSLRLRPGGCADIRMKQATGGITVVQEGRFRLATDDGRSELFVLAHDAPIEAQELPGLMDGMARVTVHYSKADGRIAGLAHDLTRPGRRPRRHIGYFSFPRR